MERGLEKVKYHETTTAYHVSPVKQHDLIVHVRPGQHLTASEPAVKDALTPYISAVKSLLLPTIVVQQHRQSNIHV